MITYLFQLTPTPLPTATPLAQVSVHDPMTTATVVIAIATVVYTFATILLFITTNRNTRITRDIFEAAHRPYIGIPEVNTTIAPNGNAVDFECIMKNFGTIPAHNVEILDASLTIDGKPANLGRLEFGQFSVFPTSQHFFQVDIHHAPNAHAILQRSRVELHVSLRYEGLAKKKYTYGYHAVYNPIAGQFTPLKEESV